MIQIQKDTYKLISELFKSAQHEYQPHTYMSKNSIEYDVAQKQFKEIMLKFCKEKEIEFEIMAER